MNFQEGNSSSFHEISHYYLSNVEEKNRPIVLTLSSECDGTVC